MDAFPIQPLKTKKREKNKKDIDCIVFQIIFNNKKINQILNLTVK